MTVERLLLKSEVRASHHYIWQSDAYGKTHYYRDRPCDIYTNRPAPCTPSGDFVSHHLNVDEALKALEKLG